MMRVLSQQIDLMETLTFENFVSDETAHENKPPHKVCWKENYFKINNVAVTDQFIAEILQ